MNELAREAQLRFPFAAPPAPGEAIEVAAGILWARLPLPFALDHVNLYFIDDGDGWAVVDAGISNDASRAAWDALLSGPLAGRRLTRLIVTHSHPDHIGLAGWLVERFGIPVYTSLSAYFDCLAISLEPGRLEAAVYRDFYSSNGVDEATVRSLTTLGHGYLRMISPLPSTYRRLIAGDVLNIGGRTFTVLSGEGHAPEQIMLHLPDEKLFFAADQVLAHISPNVSVQAMDPFGDPLGLYLRSLARLKTTVPPDTLTLAGHQLPFLGLPARIDELAEHHRHRCQRIAEACREPRPPGDLLGVLFHRKLDFHQMAFAFSEALAHVNYMLAMGELRWAEPEGSIRRVVTA
ncbi:MAG TPA: MBL fold metallo-hydrolase [Roseiarcus sp.]|nr:MBL fold metallo-hydrolase [Roseiarcus sp.]